LEGLFFSFKTIETERQLKRIIFKNRMLDYIFQSSDAFYQQLGRNNSSPINIQWNMSNQNFLCVISGGDQKRIGLVNFESIARQPEY
jgi:hypothetical protein